MIIIVPTTIGFSIANHPSREPLNTEDIQLHLYNKVTRESVTDTVTPANWFYSDGVISITTGLLTMSKATGYYLIVTQGSNSIFNSNILCTDQLNLQDYEISKGKYVSPTQASNEFITY